MLSSHVNRTFIRDVDTLAIPPYDFKFCSTPLLLWVVIELPANALLSIPTLKFLAAKPVLCTIFILSNDFGCI